MPSGLPISPPLVDFGITIRYLGLPSWGGTWSSVVTFPDPILSVSDSVTRLKARGGRRAPPVSVWPQVLFGNPNRGGTIYLVP